MITKVGDDRLHEQVNIKLDFDEDIKRVWNDQVRNGDEAAVAVVDDEVTIQLLARKIIDTACTVGDIAENQTLDISKLGNYVGD